MRPRSPLRTLALLFFAATVVYAQNGDGSENPADADATGAPTAIPVPAYVDGAYAGEVDAYLGSDDEALIVPSQVLALVDDRAIDRVLDDAAALFRGDRPVSPDAFGDLGLRVHFDWDQLVVRITVPPLVRRPQRISLSGARRVPQGTRVSPALLSIIANLDLWARYSYEEAVLEAAATPELAANVYGAVIEAQGGVRTGEAPFFLDHARATWDVRELGYRVQGGDLTRRKTELFGVARITGLSLFRERSLGDPFGNTEEILRSIYLPTTSTLRLLVNESERYSREHPPGNYEIADVPLGDGVNRVLVSWEDEDGPTQVEIVIPHDGDLLDHGDLDAGVAIGVADREIARPVVSAYQRYGLTPAVTIGLREGVEALDFQVDVGGEAMVATRIGTFVIEPSVGIGPSDRLLIDAPLRYSYHDSRPSSYLSFGLGVGYRSNTVPDGSTTTRMISGSAYVNFVLPDGFSVTPSVTNLYSLTDGTNLVAVNASLRKSIRGGSALSANLGFRHEEESAFLATITYSAAFPNARQNLFVQQNLNEQELFAFWNRYPGDGEHDVNLNVSTKVPMNTDEVASLSGRVGYAHRLFNASIGHGFDGVLATGDTRNTTSISLRSALTAADGLVGMSAPVSDSFAIIAPAGSLAETEVLVSRAGSRGDLRLAGSPGVLPGLRAYAPTVVEVEPVEFIPGLEDRELRYVLEPTYRSGTVIRVEPLRTIYAGGVLLDRDGEPIANELGGWRGSDDVTGQFFTDGEGYFELYGLLPGEYTLVLARRSELRFTVVIPDAADGFVDLDEIVAQEASQ